MKEEMLNENGIPQTDVDEIDQNAEESVEVITDKQSVDEDTSRTNEVVLDELSPEDGFFEKKTRKTNPFSVRLKVTERFIVVTVKRVESDDSQVFYLPLRW